MSCAVCEMRKTIWQPTAVAHYVLTCSDYITVTV